MKRCPECRRTYADESLNYCLDDGSVLAEPLNGKHDYMEATRVMSGLDEGATLRFPTADNRTGDGRVLWKSKTGLIVTIVAVLATAGVGGYFYFYDPPGRQINSVAVMPFVNASGNPENEYLSDGITESLISSLSRLPRLSVRARSSVFRFKGKDTDSRTLASELGVGAIVSGRIIQRGTNLSMYVELTDIAADKVIWSQQYNRPQTNLISLETEVARDISQNLMSKLSGADEKRVTKTQTENPAAYNLYLQGRFHWNNRTRDEINKAIEYFQAAIAADPNYALAYAGLADAYSLAPSNANGSPGEYFPKAKAAAEKALAMDETLAEAHAALARVLFVYDWKFGESDREFRRAIELNPNYATAHHWFGNANLLRTGRFDESIAEMKRAIELDPLSPVFNTDLGENLLHAGLVDEAIDQLQRSIQLDDTFHYAHWMLALAYEEKGRHAEAIIECKRSIELDGNPWKLGLLVYAFSRSGDRPAAERTLAEMKQKAANTYIPPYNFAVAYAALGEIERAFESLEQGYRERDQALTRLKVTTLLNPLRGDPRYADIMKRVGFLE